MLYLTRKLDKPVVLAWFIELSDSLLLVCVPYFFNGLIGSNFSKYFLSFTNWVK